MFRYWTLPNIPLFLLAAPMLTIMIVSGWWGAGVGATVGGRVIVSEKDILRKLAFLQILLACMAIVSYHVQIITRLSSGYMVWYWWVAYQMSSGERVEGKEGEGEGGKEGEERGGGEEGEEGEGGKEGEVGEERKRGKKGKEGTDWPKWVVRYMIVYGVVQGVLFAGFLPPA